jgi:hypothetical protein
LGDGDPSKGIAQNHSLSQHTEESRKGNIFL